MFWAGDILRRGYFAQGVIDNGIATSYRLYRCVGWGGLVFTARLPTSPSESFRGDGKSFAPGHADACTFSACMCTLLTCAVKLNLIVTNGEPLSPSAGNL